MTTTSTWTELWAAYFYRLADGEAATWEAELFDSIRNLSQSELCRAVRALSSRERTGSRYTLRDLRIAVYQVRKQDRVDDAPPAESCGLCSGGLIEVWPEAKTGPWTMEALAQEYVFTGPCQCSAGQKATRFQPALPAELFDLARRQHAEINSTSARAYEDAQREAGATAERWAR